MIEPTGQDLPDQILVERSRNGDREALEHLYRRYSTLARRVAYRCTSDEALADDVVQESFLALTKPGAVPRDMTAYIVGLVANQAHHRIRDQVRRHEQPLQEHVQPAVQEEFAAPAQPELGILRQELASLPPAWNHAIRLRYLEDATIESVALALETSTANARVIICRALTRLRERLGRRRCQTGLILLLLALRNQTEAGEPTGTPSTTRHIGGPALVCAAGALVIAGALLAWFGTRAVSAPAITTAAPGIVVAGSHPVEVIPVPTTPALPTWTIVGPGTWQNGSLTIAPGEKRVSAAVRLPLGGDAWRICLSLNGAFSSPAKSAGAFAMLELVPYVGARGSPLNTSIGILANGTDNRSCIFRRKLGEPKAAFGFYSPDQRIDRDGQDWSIEVGNGMVSFTIDGRVLQTLALPRETSAAQIALSLEIQTTDLSQVGPVLLERITAER